jgi:PiT family inorganic phosphate transporter
MSTASLFDSHISKPGSSGNGFTVVVVLVLLAGVTYAGTQLFQDLESAPLSSTGVYALLGVALLIALGFEMCNGFHDTSNAVATVIYTHSLKPNVAVIWSGAWNFIGVLTSSGAVAFGII